MKTLVRDVLGCKCVKMVKQTDTIDDNLQLELLNIPPGFLRHSLLEQKHSNKSKNFPTYPWNIPQTPNQQFMKEFLSFGGLGKPGVCSRGMLGFP